MSSNVNRVIVIGSGFAGAVAARQMVDAGIPVTILERGPWRDTLPVRAMGIERRSPLPSGGRLLSFFLRRVNNPKFPFGGFTLNRRGVFELHSSPQLDVVCSSQVGGGSHVYGGLNMRPAAEDYWDGHSQHINSDTMEQHYHYVFNHMGSETPQLSHNYPNMLAERFHNNGNFVTDQRSLNIPVGLKLRQEQSDAEISSSGMLGTPDGFKKTVDDIFLKGALKKQLHVKDMCEVTGIFATQHNGKDGYTIEYFDRHRKRCELHAQHLVLAACTMNTLKLLFKSRDDLGGLSGMPMLGRNFSANGDYAAYWRHPKSDHNLSIGLPIRGRVLLQDKRIWNSDHPWPLIVEGSLPYHRQLPRLPYLHRTVKNGTLLAGMGDDGMIGEINYSKGRLQIDYDPNHADIFNRMRKAFTLINSLSDSEVIDLPKVTTMHPLGGARIADSNQLGVINHCGEIFEHRGLYVADGAALPQALGVAPSMTIAAWASKVACGIIEELTNSNSNSSTKATA